MVSELSRKVDQLDAEIKKYQIDLIALEDDYSAQCRKLDEEWFRLEDANRDLNRYYEEKYEEVLAYLRQEERDTSEALMALNQIIDEYTDATEINYRQERQHLDDKEESLRQEYQQKREIVEREINSRMTQKRRILE